MQCKQRFNYSFVADDIPQSFAAMQLSEADDQNRYLDTGASSHMTSQAGNLISKRPYYGSDRILVGNGPISHVGLPHSSSNFKLNNVLLVPHLKKNWISVKRFCKDNSCSITFDGSGFSVKDMKTMVRFNDSGSLYMFPSQRASMGSTSSALSASTRNSDLWHRRLGHPGSSVLSFLFKNQFIDGSMNKSMFICNACQQGKHSKLPFTESLSSSEFPFSLIHSDVWQSPVKSVSGFGYYVLVLFLDDFFRFSWVYALRTKSEVYEKLITFKNMVENVFSAKIPFFQSDGFANNKFRKLFDDNGII